MRIYRYLMEHKAALLVVVLCFVIQGFCDLSLPRYTSNIVDTGIQQSGIERPSPTVLSRNTYEAVTMLATEDGEAVIKASYEFDASEGHYRINETGEKSRDALDEAIRLPLVVSGFASSIPDFDMNALKAAYGSGMVSKQQIVEGVDAMVSSYEGLGDSILTQQAIAAAKAEYDACGVSTADMQMDYLKRVGLAMLGFAALALLVHCIMNFFACRTATKIGRDLRERFFRRVVDFSDAEIDQFSAASLITRGTNDIQQIQMMCVMAQRMMIYTPILCIGGIIMVANTNVSMSWIIVLAIVLILLAVFILFAVTMPKFKTMQALIDKVNLVSREILTGIPVIRAFNREEFELQRFSEANTNLMRTQLFTNRAMSFMMPTMMLVMNATSALIVWVGGHYIDQGVVQTGDLIAFITYSMIIVMSFLMIGMIAIILPRANVAAQRIDEVIETASSIQDALRVYDDQLLDTPGAEICFNDVCFRYNETSKNVLDHVSFVAPAGKTTALIGSTGSGKSTVVKLIERMHDVNEGSITVDGIDVRELSQDALRGTFGYVPQKAFLFSGTIASNVGYADGADDAERISQALDIAQASDFVGALPEGVESPIAQGGTNVSGGQRQRLAIARALATDARAYLFDDSFSALDYKTDAQLRQNLATRLAGRTVVIVAQRISTIMNADNIVVLDEGRVVGQGTHDQLMENCEAYREIALSQLSEAELTKGGVA